LRCKNECLGLGSWIAPWSGPPGRGAIAVAGFLDVFGQLALADFNAQVGRDPGFQGGASQLCGFAALYALVPASAGQPGAPSSGPGALAEATLMIADIRGSCSVRLFRMSQEANGGTEVHSGRKPSNTNIGVAETPLQQKYRLLLYDQLR
jgi:hypothetical protein